jgi:hypothetical protein
MAVIQLNQKESSETIVEAGDTVDLGVLGPCLGVIIYSPNARQAYAAQLIAADDRLESLAIRAINRLGIPGNLEVYLAGASVESDSEDDLTQCILEDRAVARQILLRQMFDPARLHVRWGPVDAYTRLMFDPEKGEAKLKINDYYGNVVYEGLFEDAPLFIN